jgi:hypothetical protein
MKDLGKHEDDYKALASAKKIYSKSDGCAHCCPSAHTG